MNDLRESTEVNELLETLEKNGMEKEKSEVNALVDYIGDMEKTLTAMLSEMQEMRKEVNLIHDSTLRAKCGSLVQNADSKIRQGISVISRVKDNIIKSAKNAVEEFKTKGKEAFNMFHKFSESMRESVQNLETARSEYSESKLHKTNARRSLFGRKPIESEAVKNDKGILARLEVFCGKLARGFSSLESKSNELADGLRSKKIKESVKANLDFFKGKTDSPSISSRNMDAR